MADEDLQLRRLLRGRAGFDCAAAIPFSAKVYVICVHGEQAGVEREFWSKARPLTVPAPPVQD